MPQFRYDNINAHYFPTSVSSNTRGNRDRVGRHLPSDLGFGTGRVEEHVRESRLVQGSGAKVFNMPVNVLTHP